MLVKADERVPLARLLKFMELGEQLAHECAQAQTSLAPEPGMQCFLSGQARQERYHAWAFHGAIAWIAPRHLGPVPFIRPMDQYRHLLASAFKQKEFPETILAEQRSLDGLGEEILKKIEAGLVKRQAPFRRLRHTLLHQEEAHHAFGHRTLQRALARGETTIETLQDRAPEYLALAESMLTSATDLLEAIDEDPNEHLAEFRRCLPSWLRVYP